MRPQRWWCWLRPRDRDLKDFAVLASEVAAVDVEPGADLTGMPVFDQTARNPGAEHIEETVREPGESIGLAIPRHPAPDKERMN